MPLDMCTKPCLGPIIIRINKFITGFCSHPPIDNEHHQLMKLHDFIATLSSYVKRIM